MDAGIEKECSALGGLFQTIMNDMKSSYPAWEDFVTKGVKLQSQLRTTLIVTSSFLDAFQKVADLATGTRGATKEIGSALTRMCMRHRSIESKLKLFTTALTESLVSPLELKIEEWKKVASQLDKDHAKEYKKARADIKKKSSDTIKLQKKVKKGKGEVRMQLDSALQDVNVKYAVLEETEKRAVCRALIEERGRFCSFVSMLRPVLDEEIGMLGEVTHLQTILEDLGTLTAEPHKLPPASEQVILDLKGSDYSYSYQTPPASPGTLSRKSSISSNYQPTSVRHVPSLDSISSAVDGIHLRPASTHIPHTSQEQGLPNCLPPRQQGSAGTENGTAMPPPHIPYAHPTERARAMSTSSKPQTAREQLALTLGGGGLNSDAPRTSHDSLHCSSGYSTQTTTPSCSEDTIPSHDYDYISLHGGEEAHEHPEFDRSSTIPRNSDLGQNYRKLFQSKRPASTVSLLAEPEPLMGQSHVATIRRKPSTKPNFRRGTISGGVPIPICTPQVPLSHSRQNLCTSTQSLSSAPPSASPYYTCIPPRPCRGKGSRPRRPASPNYPSRSSTICPSNSTICPSNSSICPSNSICPNNNSICPHNSSICPNNNSICPHNSSICPNNNSICPNNNSICPNNNSICPNNRSICPNNHSICPNSRNICPSSNSICPNSRSICPSPTPVGTVTTPPPDQAAQEAEPSGGGDMLSQIRGVKLRRTLTNDRSAPMIPPNHH
ncbi:hypothetical protein COCON_G00182310 [Conger conger]|uniref:IMD domain-containing protein n=1 Tax=Conger conger TaxID=82655 RepID=A0A9Q1D5T8_CONCO|nr:hypothetical protein COCON_G00182310 [Conger conger]